MSTYKIIVTTLDDPDILRQTLEEVGKRLGFTCEVHTESPIALHAFGFTREQRAANSRPADFIIPASQVTGMIADMGWALVDGTYQVIYDDYGRGGQRVRQIAAEVAYHYTVVKAERAAIAEGYEVEREYNEAGQVVAVACTMD